MSRTSVEGFTRTPGPAHLDTIQSVSDLGDVLALQGRFDEALPLLEKALAAVRGALPAGHYSIGQTLARYGRCLAGLRRYDDAETAMTQAEEILRVSDGERGATRLANARGLAALYDAWGKPDRAARWKSVAGGS